MKKIFKIFSIMLALVTLVTLAACSSNDIKGTLEVEATSTKITATASFNKNATLEESTTVVTVKLYNESVEELLNKKTVDLGDEKVQGSVTFEDLDTDTNFVLKLYVSHGGNEYLITEITASTTSSGSTEETPIEISTVDEFLAIEDDSDAYYKLTADLDFTGQANVSVCSSSEPFKGSLDGNGHTISNYAIAVGEYAGLFEYVEDATIKNLKLSNVSIDITSTCKNVGALAGYAVNTDITDVTVDTFTLVTSSGATTTAQMGGLVGAITSLQTSSDKKNASSVTNSKALNINFNLTELKPSTNYLNYTGGFAGRISGDTTVTGCLASGALNIKTKSSNGTAYIGGFAGAVEGSQLVSASESYVALSIVRVVNTFGKLCVGGFAGGSGTGQINLKDCLVVSDIEVLSDEGASSATANIASTAYIGGIVGLVSSTPKGIKNCYYAKANFGIMVKQADDTQTTNYVDACFVSATVAKKADTVLDTKISNVYSYDDCLTVIGMTVVTSTADTASYVTVLSDTLKAHLEEAIALRNTVTTEVVKLNIEKYAYTSAYSAAADVEFAETVTPVVLGNSDYLTVDSHKLTITPTGTSAYSVVRLAFAGSNITLNQIIHVVVA